MQVGQREGRVWPQSRWGLDVPCPDPPSQQLSRGPGVVTLAVLSTWWPGLLLDQPCCTLGVCAEGWGPAGMSFP